jgi:hypothetical protein
MMLPTSDIGKLGLSKSLLEHPGSSSSPAYTMLLLLICSQYEGGGGPNPENKKCRHDTTGPIQFMPCTHYCPYCGLVYCIARGRK